MRIGRLWPCCAYSVLLCRYLPPHMAQVEDVDVPAADAAAAWADTIFRQESLPYQNQRELFPTGAYQSCNKSNLRKSSMSTWPSYKMPYMKVLVTLSVLVSVVVHFSSSTC